MQNQRQFLLHDYPQAIKHPRDVLVISPKRKLRTDLLSPYLIY